MTSKTSILLIIQQNPGIDYQSLLSKTAPNYANLNSARAALSRVLKDAVSFGMVTRQENQLFLTDKGVAGLKVKMHDKLILKLNSLMKIRTVAQNPDPLVQHLSILLERGKMDPRLLDNARASTSFSVNDLERVHVKLQENIRHLSYLEKTLEQQVESLRGQNFPVSQVVKNADLLPNANKGLDAIHVEEVQVEHPSHSPLENHPLFASIPHVTSKGNRVSIPPAHFSTLLARLAEQEEHTHPPRVYAGLLTLDTGKEHTIIRGPSQVVEKFAGTLSIQETIDTLSLSQTPLPSLPAEPLTKAVPLPPRDDTPDEPYPTNPPPNPIPDNPPQPLPPYQPEEPPSPIPSDDEPDSPEDDENPDSEDEESTENARP
ncbi:MAG: hypothetical protein V1776_01380 [Candidatus Diapherotrites archaeon]